MFADLLRTFRERAGLSQEELAEAAGLSPNAIGALERGVRKSPYPHTVRALADALKLNESERAQLLAARGGGPAPAPAPRPDPARAQLPLLGAPLIGRAAERATLEHLLLRERARLVTLAGLGGAGKTHLALDTAHRLAAHYAQGAAFVSLGTVTEAAALPGLIAGALGVQLGAPHTAAALGSQMAEHQRLIVLDNMEQLLAPEQADATIAAIEDLLKPAPDVALLVTSREPLQVSFEHVLALGGLAIAAGSGAPSDAELMFVQRARQRNAAFALTPDNAAAVRRICIALDGLPLGLALAASWADAMTPAEIAREIEGDAGALGTPLRDVPARHRSLHHVLDHAWQRLEPGERGMMAALALFEDGFSRAAAGAVADAALPALQSLVGKAFVQHEAHGRYRVHPLVRQFALRAPASDAARQAVEQRHAEFFEALALAQTRLLSGKTRPPALALLQADDANLTRALGWLETRAPDRFARLVADLHRYWDIAGQFGVSQQWIARALTRVAPDANPAARILNCRAACEVFEARYAAARATAAQAGALCEAHREFAWQAEALLQQAWACHELGDADEGRALFERAIALAEQSGGMDALTRVLNVYAMVLTNKLVDLDAAERVLDRCDALYVALDDALGRGRILMRRSGIAAMRGQVADAARDSSQAVTLFRALVPSHELGWALCAAGHGQIEVGNFAEAWALLEEGDAVMVRTGSRWGRAVINHHLGRLAVLRAQIEPARAHFSRALRLSSEAGRTELVSRCVAGAAALAQLCGEPARARRWLAAAQPLFPVDLSTLERAEYEALARQLGELPAPMPLGEIVPECARWL